MSPADRDNPYTFDTFVQMRNQTDYYGDDPFIQQVVQHFSGEKRQQVDEAARRLSAKASFRWRDFADEAARPENRPSVLNYNDHNNRIVRIVRPWSHG